MIQITKPIAAPARLAQGDDLTMQNRLAYEANPDGYLSGTHWFPIDRDIYGHKTVKQALADAQHQKCCYCENKFLAAAHGDVEHYRPKKGVKQRKKTGAIYPGYYWLAYDWGNLYFSCGVCNESWKGILFPLVDPTTRVRNHLGNLAAEAPLLIDPGGPDDPRNHIYFHGEVAVGRTEKGKSTEKVVGLNRALLTEDRLEKAQEIRLMLDVVYASQRSPENAELARVAVDAQEFLRKAVLPDAKFSAMASDLINPPPESWTA